VRIEPDVTIYPGVILEGQTRIGKGTVVGPNAFLRNTTVGDSAEIKSGTVAEESTIGNAVKVGPYAHLRPGSMVRQGAKIGNFVELKKTVIGENTSVAHLSYLGDAEVGKNVNIGCGFVTCNYDGRVIDGSRKHKTVIEDEVFVGSDCQTVAPVTLKRGSFVASGSTITETVEEDALAIARTRQVVKPGYAKKLRGQG
jgi:bifunctional UDP-N-acetylglucosamine pyrophosphorylase/glucosamine-1-phosphate N-acetyltransferase